MAIVPVLNIGSVDAACKVAEVLLKEDLGVLELTFRNHNAAAVMFAVKKKFPEILMGAGTVRNVDQLNAAIDAGSDFLVSPSIVPSVISEWKKQYDGGAHSVNYVPGISSPRELEEALEWGLNFIKFFPAEAAGGVPMLKALAATHGEISFMPTGGISHTNLANYLSLPNVAACGASALVPKDAISTFDPQAISRSIALYRDVIKSV